MLNQSQHNEEISDTGQHEWYVVYEGVRVVQNVIVSSKLLNAVNSVMVV